MRETAPDFADWLDERFRLLKKEKAIVPAGEINN